MIGILPLFCQAQLIDETQMHNVLGECGQRGISAGKFLVESGAMSQELVRAAIFAKLLLNDGLVTITQVSQLLRLVATSDMSTEEALSQLGWSTERSLYNKLTQEILVGTGMMREQVYTAVKDYCEKQQMLPLAVLVETRFIGAAFADDVIRLIKDVLEQKISFQEVAELLDEQNEPGLGGLQQFKVLLKSMSQNSALLGRLILAAFWVNHSDLVRAAEIAVCKQQQIGSVLVALGAITKVQLHMALEIQRNIRAESISVFEGITELQTYARKRSSGSTHEKACFKLRKPGSNQKEVA